MHVSILLLALTPVIFAGSGGDATHDGIRRLTHSQYNNTVRDLLGDQTRPADQFPPEDFQNGFKNQISTQEISPLLAEAYNLSAERLARNAFAGGDDSNHLIPCEPRNEADAECASAFVKKFGSRTFRRPLATAEAQRYIALLQKEARRSHNFQHGAQLVVEAMLQSPKFLFRLESGAYKTASDLSYFLWDTMPDDPLCQAAATGKLNSEAERRREAVRLIQDARARQSVDEFTAEWLRFDQVLNTVKDRNLFPQFNLQLATAMTEETRRMIADLVWGDKDFMDLFRADYAFINSDLATLYKLPAPASEFDRVKFPADSDRAGIVGQAAFLAMTSKPADTSPTVRGLFICEEFLCQMVPDPPPGVNSALPPILAEKPQTNRQRLQEHLTNRTCAGCHTMMDPIGFGLEKFDAIGQKHDKQKITVIPQHGADRKMKPITVELDIDPSATVNGLPNSQFSSPKELGQVLAASPLCQECMVKQLFRYAFGRKETEADQPYIQKGLDVFRASNFRWKELMLYFATAKETSVGKS
ncbi:MAG: DUF1592 domain-containing protein [Acidobacteriota bacterium]|nr:DUF1592 domain-containing protein [Acidobacteriota bacterium]